MNLPLRFAIFGAGFWARVQLAAWREVGGVECVAIYNRSHDKAETFARDLGVPAVYDDAEKLLREVRPGFVDNITEVGGHKSLSLLCAKHRVPRIVQKPMATSLKNVRDMVAAFARAKTPLERECFPQTLAFVEGPLGSIEVTDDHWLRVTTKKGTHSRRYAPPRYTWADPRYDLAQSSTVPCHRDLLAALRGERAAETTGATWTRRHKSLLPYQPAPMRPTRLGLWFTRSAP